MKIIICYNIIIVCMSILFDNLTNNKSSNALLKIIIFSLNLVVVLDVLNKKKLNCKQEFGFTLQF